MVYSPLRLLFSRNSGKALCVRLTQRLGSVARVTTGSTSSLPNLECPPAPPRKPTTLANGGLTVCWLAELSLGCLEKASPWCHPNAGGNSLPPALEELYGVLRDRDAGVPPTLCPIGSGPESLSHFKHFALSTHKAFLCRKKNGKTTC